jgi:hypothetical protein
MDLAPSLRNFDDGEAGFQLDPARRRGPAAAPFRFRASTRLKGKTNPSFRQAKRSVSQGCRNLLESLWAPNQAFRGIVCFQRLGSVFVSPFSSGVCFQ